MEEIRQVWRGEFVNGLECEQQNLELDTELNREPVELLEDRSDMVSEGGAGYDAGSRVLEQLEFMEGFLREAEEERVAIIQAGSDEAVNKRKVEVGSPGYVIDVGL